MKLFDSHCHIDDKSFNKDLLNVIENARKEGVISSMVVGVTKKSSEKAVKIADKYENIYASVGIHPHHAKDCDENTLDDLIKLSKKGCVKAWGETGLDFNRMFSDQNDQEKCFIRQLEIADNLELPLIFHERDSGGRFLEILKATHTKNRRGVVHCFSGSLDEMNEYIELGYYIGITGIITIQKRGLTLRDLIHHIPKDKILIETDAPYLTPAPQKNKTRRNEPAFVKSTFLRIADILNEDIDSFSKIVWDNTVRLFGI